MGWMLRLFVFAGTVGLVFTTGCAGSGGGGRNDVVPSAGDALSAPASSAESLNLYVANSSAVLVWPASASGDVSPAVEIGENTGCNIGLVSGVAVDNSGTVFALNNGNAIEEFRIQKFSPPKVKQIGAIAGNNTGLSESVNDTVDAAGNIYATNFASITEYASGAQGNASPIATIAGSNTGLTPPTGGQGPLGIAVDAKGTIYVTDRFFGPAGGVLIFAPGSNGNVAPIATISGTNTLLSQPFGIAVDAAGNIYVANDGSSGVTVYAPGSNGNVAPIRQIAGSNTELGDVAGVTVDTSGKIYTASSLVTFAHISVFAADANGDVAPVSILSSSVLFEPGELALHQTHP
jgi:sugar lactone lactonase YvrE